MRTDRDQTAQKIIDPEKSGRNQKRSMQKFLVSILFLSIAALVVQTQTPSVSAQPQTAERAELARLNNEMLQAYKAANYDEALKSGQQALSLSSRLFGEESPETASVAFNLGAVYRAKKQYAPAKDNFQRALAIYQKHFPQGSARVIATYNELGLISYEKKETREAEQWFLKALELSEKLNGIENKETIAYVSSLATIYQLLKEYEKAEAYYWRAREDAKKTLDGKGAQYEAYSDNYECYTFTERDNLKDVLARRKAERKASAGSREIINGKALILVRPPYPRGASPGSVMVKVQIDESGNVITARAFCGPADLWPVSEAAALKSKFSPTLLKDVPVKVVGNIVYNFQR